MGILVLYPYIIYNLIISKRGEEVGKYKGVLIMMT